MADFNALGRATAVEGASPQAPGNGPAPMGGPSAGFLPDHIHAALAAAHNTAKARFEQTAAAMRRMDVLGSGLVGLLRKADTVTEEDVLKEAGKLVGHGIEPAALAGLLADMPLNGGEAISEWLAGHLQQVMQNHALVAQAHAQARHDLGVAAMQQLAGDSLRQPQVGTVPPASPGNALTTPAAADETAATPAAAAASPAVAAVGSA